VDRLPRQHSRWAEQQYAFFSQHDERAIVLAPVVAGDACGCVDPWSQQADFTEQ